MSLTVVRQMTGRPAGSALLACLVLLAASSPPPVVAADSNANANATATVVRDANRTRGDDPMAGRQTSPDRQPSAANLKPPPGKRDFQDHNPPTSAEELYRRYDSSVAVTTAALLGAMLGCIVGRVMIKWLGKQAKRQLRRTRRFGKYFPERELPPLHVALQIAEQQGMVLSDDLLLKLTNAETRAGRRVAESSKSAVAVAAAAAAPGVVLESVQLFPPAAIVNQASRRPPTPTPTPKSIPVDLQSPPPSMLTPNGQLLGAIRVNIIGATPSITPNVSYRNLPEFLSVTQRPPNRTPPLDRRRSLPGHCLCGFQTSYDFDVGVQPSAPPLPQQPPPPQQQQQQQTSSDASSLFQDAQAQVPLVVTTATIELQPFGHSPHFAHSSTPNGSHDDSLVSSTYCLNRGTLCATHRDYI